jgi:hypothetical protein
VGDAYSKVTRRPRSKLERLVDRVEPPAPRARTRASDDDALARVKLDATSARVAARLGFPGATREALERSLAGELPIGDPTELATRAVRALNVVGATNCASLDPQCDACPFEDGCDYRGRGADPAGRAGVLDP